MMRLPSSLLALLALAGALRADTISYTGSWGSNISQVPVGDLPLTETLPKFDTALGTLSGVTLTLTAQGTTAIVQVYNIANAPRGFVNATTTVDLTLTSDTGSAVEIKPVAGPFAGLASPGFSNVGAAVLPAVSASINVAPSAFFAYSFPGVQSFGLTLSGFATASGTATIPGTVFFGGDGSSYGTFGVTYTFVPIPESDFFGLAVAGAAMLLALGRRRLQAA